MYFLLMFDNISILSRRVILFKIVYLLYFLNDFVYRKLSNFERVDVNIIFLIFF